MRQVAPYTALASGLLLAAACEAPRYAPPEAPAPDLWTAGPYDHVDRSGAIDLRMDEGCDGVTETCLRTTWDRYGRLLREEYVYNCELPMRACRTVRYEQETGWIETINDDDCDGTPSYCSFERRDHEGNLLLAGVGCDRSGAHCHRHTTHADGRLDRFDYDFGCDGAAEQCERYLYTELGTPIGYTSDWDCDGTPEECFIHTEEGPGSLARALEDLDCARSMSYCTESTLDPDGNTSNTCTDTNCTGSFRDCTAYIRDANGRVLDELHDRNLDGTPDSCFHRRTEQDGALRRQRRLWDQQCDGQIDSCDSTWYDSHDQEVASQDGCRQPKRWCKAYTYDAAGRILTLEADDDCDGRPQTCEVYTYNARGDMIRLERDVNCNGNVNYCQSWIYDAYGRLRAYTEDRSCDGEPDVCYTSEVVAGAAAAP